MNSKSVKESVSALVDGQEENSKAIDKLKHDASLSASFANYHLIGDAMRNELPDNLNLDLAANIAAAIDKEPVSFAPNAKVTAQNENTAESKKSNVISWFKPAAQYGIAASFAAALVIGFQTETQQDVHVPQPVLQTFPIGGSLDPVSMQQVESVPTSRQYSAAEQSQRINAYIMDHAQQLKSRQTNAISAEQVKLQQTEPELDQ
jgi:sigma-E factor negative regulatory protein RseA